MMVSRFGLLGQSGHCRFLVDAREAVIACYCIPREGNLFAIVPLPARLLPAANDA